MQENFILDSINEYLEVKQFNSAALKKQMSKGTENLFLVIKNLNENQKDFYIKMLSMVASVAGDVNIKTHVAIGICINIGQTEDIFHNKVEEVNSILKN